MQSQAQAIGLPHQLLTVQMPYEHGYEVVLQYLRDTWDIQCVITGDIAEVDGLPNWIEERCQSIGMEVYMPLWGRQRSELLETLISHGFKVCFSCVHMHWLESDWLGRMLTAKTMEELVQRHERHGLDLCGEQGEYHTMVLDGPIFKQPIVLPAYVHKQTGERVHFEFC